MLSEPPRSAYDLNFRVLGIPVRVHPLFWLVAVLLGISGTQGDPKQLLLWVGAVFVSILIHEMGHALAARAYGWEPWITLHGFGGLASYQPTYRSPRSQILISFAGPLAGFLFAAIILALMAASGHAVEFELGYQLLPRWDFYSSMRLNELIFDLLYINIYWGLVNLLPIYPLDGGQIAREALGVVNPRDGLRQSLWLSIFTAAGIAVVAFTRLHDQYPTLFFGYLAYLSYTAMQGYFGSGGGGGFR